MFGIWGEAKRVAGIDIKPECIRFIEIENKNNTDRITAYGEVTFDGVEPDDEALVRYLSDIKKNLRSKKINVVIPVGSDETKCAELLKSAGIKVSKIMSPEKPLEFALIPENGDTSFILVNVEKSQTEYLVFGPKIDSRLYVSDPTNHSVISNLNRLYIDWYDRHKEKIHHVVFSGARAGDQDFIDYVSRETKIPILLANIFVNLKLDYANVPIINKNDSYKYAVALGAAVG